MQHKKIREYGYSNNVKRPKKRKLWRSIQHKKNTLQPAAQKKNGAKYTAIYGYSDASILGLRREREEITGFRRDE